jgi:V/A-type H+-transporting ATPase subunit G/H
MVDETLKRLLDAEMEAERIVAHADEERQAIIEQAKRDVSAAEQQHAEHIAKIQASSLALAEQRAQQTIAAMQRRYAEQALALRASADLHEPQALAKAIALLTGMNMR